MCWLWLPNQPVVGIIRQNDPSRNYSHSQISDTTTVGIFRQFLSQPSRVGAVAASSSVLANAMIDSLDWERISVLVEYGPGTGAITRQIFSRIQQNENDQKDFFAIEVNDTFAENLATSFPDLDLAHDSVANIEQLLHERGHDQMHAVVSGLPWTAFNETLQDELLLPMIEHLSDGGEFVTFAYVHGLPLKSAKRFRKKLRDHFSSVVISRTIWRNIPPAIFYTCRK